MPRRPRPSPDGHLCENCQKISIETLSKRGGYVHSMVDVLEASAETCELCYVFITALDQWLYQWTIKRYKLKLSFIPPEKKRRTRRDFLDHARIESLPKYIEISVWTTGPVEGKYNPRIPEHKYWEWLSCHQLGEDQFARRVYMLCYTEKGDPAMHFGMPWLRRIGPHTGSAESLQVAKGWLEQCMATETNGSSYATLNIGPQKSPSAVAALPFPAEQPARLLEIHCCHVSERQCPTVKLIHTNGRSYSYAALSYCWGQVEGEWLTKTNTLQQYLHRVDLESLPHTITNAIDATAGVGIGYLWVDALCIIQDSADDWKTESAKMGGIYQGALLTIAASKSVSSEGGCFNQIQTPKKTILSDYIKVSGRLSSGSTSHLYFENSVDNRWELQTGYFGSEVDKSPLSKRAWTYQEQVLSRRILYFSESQLYWECDHCRLSEDNSPQAHAEREYPVLTFTKPLSTKEVVTKWYEGAVQTYSNRHLTYHKDKLTAISAVAKATYLNRHVPYIAGLWEDCIIEGLCWYRNGPGKKERVSPWPSWSWASQESAVLYKMRRSDWNCGNSDPRTPPPRILGFDAEKDKTNPFGDVTNGRITLRTMVTTGQVMPGQTEFVSDEGFLWDADINLLFIEDRNDTKEWTEFVVLDDDGNNGQEVTLALLSDWDQQRKLWTVLLLQKVPNEERIYRRVGLGLVGQGVMSWDGRYDTQYFKDNWERKDIVIV